MDFDEQRYLVENAQFKADLELLMGIIDGKADLTTRCALQNALEDALGLDAGTLNERFETT